MYNVNDDKHHYRYDKSENKWYYVADNGHVRELCSNHVEQGLARKICYGYAYCYMEALIPIFCPYLPMIELMYPDSYSNLLYQDYIFHHVIIILQSRWRGYLIRQSRSSKHLS